MNEQDNRLFRISKVLLPLMAGISITLLIEVLADDLLFYRLGVPLGWFSLWWLTTPVTIAMGLGALAFRSWRTVSFEKRWLNGLGYLVLGLFNVLDLGLLVDGTYFQKVDLIWWAAYIYAAFLFAGFVFLAYRVNLNKEIFP